MSKSKPVKKTVSRVQVKKGEKIVVCKARNGEGEKWLPKGWHPAIKGDSREVKCLKSLLRKLKTYTDKTSDLGKNAITWNAGIGICIGEVKTRIEKESKVRHYSRG